MNNCQWPGCVVLLAYSGRGRPPEYCPEHAKASKTRADKARPVGGHIRKSYPQCCLDAQAAKVRASGTRTIRYPDWRGKPLYEPYARVVKVGSAHVRAAIVRTCPQHQDWHAWYRLDRTQELAEWAEQRAEESDPQGLAEITRSQRFRLTPNHPDGYFVPDPAMDIEVPSPGVGWDDIPKPAVISGYHAKIEAETRRFLAEANGEQEKSVNWLIAEPEPPSNLGYWRDKCAEGRRWHKTDAFRYSPEMNRGAGWCAKLIPLGRRSISSQARRADHSHSGKPTAAGLCMLTLTSSPVKAGRSHIRTGKTMDKKVSKESFKAYRDWQRYILSAEPKLENIKIGKRTRPRTKLRLVAYCLAMASHGTNGLGCYASDATIAKELGLHDYKSTAPYRTEALRLGWFVWTGEMKGRTQVLDIAIPEVVTNVAPEDSSQQVAIPKGATNVAVKPADDEPEHNADAESADDCPGCQPLLGSGMTRKQIADYHDECLGRLGG